MQALVMSCLQEEIENFTWHASKFTHIYKMTIHLLLLLLQFFSSQKYEIDLRRTLCLYYKHKVGINIYFSNVASKYGLMF